MMAKPRLPAAAIAAALALFAGCQPATTPTPAAPSTAATGPNVAPTYACTAEFGGNLGAEVTPRVCTKARYDAMKKRDAEYADAERVYRKFHAADEALARGDSEGTQKELREVTSASVYRATLEQYRGMSREGSRVSGGKFDLRWIVRAPTSDSESVLALATCTDMTSVKIIQRNREVETGQVLLRKVEFSRDGGRLRIFRAGYKEGVKC